MGQIDVAFGQPKLYAGSGDGIVRPFPEAAVVGANAWGDESDGTYAQVAVKPFWVGNTYTTYWDYAYARPVSLAPLAEIPAGAADLAYSLVVRSSFLPRTVATGTPANPDTTQLILYAGESTDWRAVVPGQRADYTAIAEGVTVLSGTERAELLAGGYGYFSVHNSSRYLPDSNDKIVGRIHRVFLRATWTDGYHPTRQYPRDDGHGHSSARRVYPPSKAQRVYGGYQ